MNSSTPHPPPPTPPPPPHPPPHPTPPHPTPHPPTHPHPTPTPTPPPTHPTHPPHPPPPPTHPTPAQTTHSWTQYDPKLYIDKAQPNTWKTHHVLNSNAKVKFVLEHNISSTSKSHSDASWTPICWGPPIGWLYHPFVIGSFNRSSFISSNFFIQSGVLDVLWETKFW